MNRHTKGIFNAVFGVLLMSCESVIIKASNLHWTDVAFTLGLSLIISINLMLISKGQKFFAINYLVQKKGVIICGICTGLSNLSFVIAVIYAGVANTVLILATSPIFSAIFMRIFFKQKTQKSVFLATFFIFIGLYITLKNDLVAGSFIGICLAFVCVTFMVTNYIALATYKRVSRISYISLTGICLMSASLPFAKFDFSMINSYLLVTISGLLVMPISRYFLGLGARDILPQETSLIFIIESVFAPIWAWLFIGDKMDFNTIFGGFIIVATLVLYILSTLKPQARVIRD